MRRLCFGMRIDGVLGLWAAMLSAFAISGCGGDPTGLGGTNGYWSHGVWVATGGNADNPDPNDSEPVGEEPPVHVPTVVAGEYLLRHGADGLYVSAEEIDFGLTGEAQSVMVQYRAGGMISCRNKVDVDWAAVEPERFSNGGELDELVVTVKRAGLEPGHYEGELSIQPESGTAVRIPLRVQVGGSAGSPPGAPDAPKLEVSAAVLALGVNGIHGTFVLSNSGSGSTSFGASAAADWVRLKPSEGVIGSVPVTIEVSADLRSLLVGSHATTVTIESPSGPPLAVKILLTKEALSPRMVPWHQISVGYKPEEVDEVVASLKKWQRVTDTVSISTGPGQSALFRELRERLPGMQIIPSLSTVCWLGYNGLDSVTPWQAIGREAAAVAEICGQSRVVLENEGAMRTYIQGTCPINESKMRESLRQLPGHLEYIWYPALYINPKYPDEIARSEALCRWAEDELDCRFVDVSFGDPYWAHPDYVAGRNRLEAFAQKPTMPVAWFGCDYTGWCYWQYPQAQEPSQAMAGRPDFLVYPIDWLGSADELVPRLVMLYPAAP